MQCLQDLRETVKMRAVLTVELVAFILSECSERKTEGLNLTFQNVRTWYESQKFSNTAFKEILFFFFAARENIGMKTRPFA